MTTRINELEAFKTDIDLRVVAGDLGYAVNRKRSSRGSTCMDNAAGDRILVALASDGHYVYCSVGDPGDAGSVIDFWQKRRGGTLGEVRKALRPFLRAGGAPPPLSGSPPSGKMLPSLRHIERDILGVQARYQGFEALGGFHAYLCDERKIPAEILALPLFAERLCVDERGNAVFPHFNNSGLCGYEARSHNFVSFSKGGVKGLFCSVPSEDDNTLVIAESAIDAISIAVIRGTTRARFVSFSGGFNNDQPALLRRVMDRMPAGSSIVGAVDNDDAGDGYLARLQGIFDELGRGDLVFSAERPFKRGSDWNDALCAVSGSPQLVGDGRPEPR